MGTNTPNLALYRPAVGETGWGSLVNTNFDTLDGALSAVQFVTTAGNDANSGKHLGRAKLTIGAAITALPSTGGTVYYETGVWAQADHTKGLWFTNSGASGYIQDKHLNMIALGVSSSASVGLAAGYPQGVVNGPDVMFKWDYFSATTQHYYGVAVNNTDVAMRMGINDAGNRTLTGCQNKYFEGCSFRTVQTAGKGPCIDMGSNVFWVWFNNCVMIGNEQESHTSDKRCAMLIDPDSGSTAGLVFLDGVTFGGGSGVRMRPGPTGGLRFTMRNITTEGTTGGADGAASQQPALDLVDGSSNGSPSYAGSIIVDSVTTADSGGTLNPAVRIYSGVRPNVVYVNAVDSVQGPCTLLGTSGFTPRMTVGNSWVLNTMNEQRQRGWDYNHRLVGQVDAARRQSPLSAARYANLAPQDTSTWSGKIGSATVTTGQADPFGGTNAAKLHSASGNVSKQVYRATRAVSVGDWFIGGVWMRTDTADVTISASDNLTIGTAGGTGTTTPVTKIAPVVDYPPRKQWVWNAMAVKLSAAGTNPEIIFSLSVDTTTDMHYALPVFCHIPVADGWTDAELFEFADQLGAWPDGAPVGSVSTVIGQKLIARGGLGVGNSVAATESIGKAVVKKIQVFDETGASIGYVPVYSSIT